MPTTRRQMLRLLPVFATQAAAGCAAPAARPGLPADHAERATPPTEFFAMPDGALLPVRAWLPARPPVATVLALHGYNDSRDAWEYPAPAMAEAGIAVYAPDQRGFGAAPGRGTWPGADALANDAAAMLRALRARNPAGRLVLIGESMGGAVAMLAATRPDAPMDGTAMLAPAVWGRSQMNPLLTGALFVAARLAPNFQVTGRDVPIRLRASDNHAALQRLARDELTLRHSTLRSLRGLVDLMDAALAAAPAMPSRTLFLYGAQDRIVPQHAMYATWHQLPATARRARYPDGYHLLLRDHARALPTADLIAWITRPDAPLPSSAELGAAAWMAADVM